MAQFFGCWIWSAIAAAVLAVSVIPPVSAQNPSGRVARDELAEVCTYVAAIKPSELDQYSVRGGVFDIDGDGISEVVTPTYEGSMNTESFDIRSETGEEKSLNYVGFEWKDYWTYGARWLLYRDRAYLLAFAEETALVPRYLVFSDGEGSLRIGCLFETAFREIFLVRDRPLAPVCEAAERGTVAYFEPSISDAAPRLDLPWSTYRRGEISVDYDNDGNATRLEVLTYDGGGGRGCSATYFDLPELVGDDVEPESPRALLLALQGVTPDSHTSVPNCQAPSVRWFGYDGRVFLENKFRGFVPEDDRDAVHWVHTVRDGAVVNVCESIFGYDTVLRSIADPTRE